MSLPRAAVVARIASALTRDVRGHPLRVAVDGVTAAGKSTLAREIHAAIEKVGRPAIHLSMDHFHHPREHRHRRGRFSAAGYYEDAYDFASLIRWVLTPLGPNGDRRYRCGTIDLDTDRPTAQELRVAPVDAIVLVDGTFLQRPEMVALWDHRIFVRTSLQRAREWGVERDANSLGGWQIAQRLFEERYHAACRRYLEAISPASTATFVVDNDDPSRPLLIRHP
jgi:uridine kinase